MRARRTVCSAAVAVLATLLTVGTATGVAFADEPPPTTADGPVETTVDEPTATPTPLTALAAARDALAATADPSSGASTALDATTAERVRSDALTLRAYFTEAPATTMPGLDLNFAQLEILAEDVLRFTEPDGALATVNVVSTGVTGVGDIAAMRSNLGTLGGALRVILAQPLPPVPSASDVAATAHAVADFVQNGSGMLDEVPDLQVRMNATSIYLQHAGFVDDVDDADVGATISAVDTLLVSLGNLVTPVPSTLAPTAEEAFAASGSFVSWADDLAAATGDADEPTIDPPLKSVDDPVFDPESGPEVAVGEEVVVTPAAPYVMRAPGVVDDVLSSGGVTMHTAAATATGGCGMYSGEYCAPPVRTHGGNVMRSPTVRVIFWGSYWDGQSSLRAGVTNLYASMSGSAYQSILQQYYDSRGYIGTSVTYGGSYIDRISPVVDFVTQATAASEAARVSKRLGWPTSDNTVWVIVLPPQSLADSGSSRGPYGICGYQGYGASGGRKYAVAVLDVPTPYRCNFIENNLRGSLTTIAAHEYVGVVTNPWLNGWYDGLNQHLPDLCRALFFDGPGGEKVSRIWSDGNKGCVTSFTPTFRYRVDTRSAPPGDNGPGTVMSRGHSYKGGLFRVTNTGTMPWIPFSSTPTYLATAGDECSKFYDWTSGSGWASCRRIKLDSGGIGVLPGETTAFSFTMRPDARVLEGAGNEGQSFRLVVENRATMTASSGSAPGITGLKIGRYNATAVVPPGGYFAAGAAGSDVTVKVNVLNSGASTWYPNEVVNIGTPAGTSSRYAAGSWPTGPGGCRKCRAHRVKSVVPPNGNYSFDLVLHIPAGTLPVPPPPAATLLPVADVVRADTRTTVSAPYMTNGRFDVQFIVVPTVVGSHDVTGYALFGRNPSVPDVVVPEAPDLSGTATMSASLVTLQAGSFGCLAVATVDASTTAIDSCVATVTKASGEVRTYYASATSSTGAVATTVFAGIDYDDAAGDAIRVCWSNTATFLSGSPVSRSDCAQSP